MNQARTRATSRAVPVSIAILFVIITALAACDLRSRTWAWTGGKTHGAIIETTAGRASLAIYREPSNALHSVYAAVGIRAVQDLLWDKGYPPPLRKTFTYKGHSYTVSFGAATRALRQKTHDWIYNDPNDLRAALVEASVRRECLALTLISYGKPTSNWTHKRTDCQNGAVP